MYGSKGSQPRSKFKKEIATLIDNSSERISKIIEESKFMMARFNQEKAIKGEKGQSATWKR